MGQTANYQIPFPELGDKPDGATQMKNLATQVDVKLKPIDDRVATNASGLAAFRNSIFAVTLPVTATAVVTQTVTVNFQVGLFAVVPAVIANTTYGTAYCYVSATTTSAVLNARKTDQTAFAAGATFTIHAAILGILAPPTALLALAEGVERMTICTTPDCPNEGIDIAVSLDADLTPEELDGVVHFCGPCGQLITDVR